jgi:mannose-6-phosphate isomerase-like protein (cupin superfamily)
MKFFLAALALNSALAAPALSGQQQQAVISNPYSPPKDPSVLTTTFVDWDSLVPRSTAAGQTRPVFDNPTTTLDKFEVHITTLNPGKQSHPVHHHPWEEMLLVKEGDFEVNINGKPQHAGPGALVFLASNDPHNARNVGSTPGTYYVINFVSDLAHDSNAAPAAEQNLPGKLASGVYSPGKPTPTKTGQRVVVVHSPTVTFQDFESHITTLNPGQISGPDLIDHNDEFVVIQSGQVEITVNGVASRMNAGSVLFWAPNVKRTIRNLGATPASYQVFRVTTAKSRKQ